MNKPISFSLSAIETVAQELMPAIRRARIVALYGGLGAGKTTLVRALVHTLGVMQSVTSPTFNYVNRYVTADGSVIYHFDLYRLASLGAFYEAGFDEYLFDESVLVFIEWPEILEPLLPAKALRVQLAYEPGDEQVRVLTMDTVELAQK